MGRAQRKWARRKLKSVGSHFRIEAGSPKNGINGPESAKIYFTNDEGEVFLLTQDHGLGLARIASDKSIEVRAGDKNNPNQIDIRVSAATGDITINADRGRVRVHAKDISMSADQDVDIKAGRNVNLKAGSGRVYIQGNTATVKAKRGNLVPKTWGQKVLENSFVPDDVIDGTFGAKAQNPQTGAAPGGFDGKAGAALQGAGFTLEDLGLSELTGAADSLFKDKELGLDAFGKFQEVLNDPLGSAAGLLGDDVANAISTGTEIFGTANSLLGGGSLSSLGAVNSVLGGGFESLTAGAQAALGVADGSLANTGIQGISMATGPLGKMAAATIGSKSGDAMAALDSAATPSPPLKTGQELSNAEVQAIIQAERDLIAAQDSGATISAEFATADESRLLLRGETVSPVSDGSSSSSASSAETGPDRIGDELDAPVTDEERDAVRRGEILGGGSITSSGTSIQ